MAEGLGAVRLRGSLGVLVCLAAFGLALPASPAVGATAKKTPNACRLLGVTRALAVKVFGKGSTVVSGATTGGTPPNLGAYCVISQSARAAHYMYSIDAEPYAASQFSALKATYDSVKPQTPLRGLGHGAVFAHNTDPSQDVVEFKRGKYAVLLDCGGAGGEPKKYYPTEKMYLTVAHAVHKHLG